MIKKLLILLLLSLGVVSCRKQRVEATGIESSLHRIVGILTEGSGNRDFLELEDYINNEKGIRYDSLGIEITTEVIYTGVALNNIGIINSAYALKLPNVFDKISEIKVTSNKDYNEEYVKGANLLNILSAISPSGSRSYELTNKMPVLEVFKELDYYPKFLLFNVPPSNSEEHIFTITISTTDGKRFNTITEEVFLRKD